MKQALNLSQKLAITPQLHQAIKVLQLPRLELQQYLRQQMMENPVLDEKDYGIEEPLLNIETTSEQILSKQLQNTKQLETSASDSIDWEVMARNLESMQSGDVQSRVKHKKSSNNNLDEAINYEKVISAKQSLSDYLLSQIGMFKITNRQSKLLKVLIGNLDSKGYLATDLKTLSEKFQCKTSELEVALEILQKCDPSGVGARGLVECLTLQMKAMNQLNPLVVAMISDFSLELYRRNYAKIAKKLKVTTDQIKKALEIISSLDPEPARAFNISHNTYITVDVFASYLCGKWHILANEEGLPSLKVSSYYQKLVNELKKEIVQNTSTKNASSKKAIKKSINAEDNQKDLLTIKQAKQDKNYLLERINAAKWLIKSLHQRQSTIVRVCEVIIDMQRDFFEKGCEHLKPMNLNCVAQKLDVHSSTVSRVTSGKYMQTPRGIFELRYFFTASAISSNGPAGSEDQISSASVKQTIKQLFDNEDPRRPLSDQNVVSLLADSGIEVARRTVAKYRNQLGIKNSAKRRKFCA